MYYGDASGRPVALYGIMDHVHRLRLERDIGQRDQLRTGEPKWLDNTIDFAATVFNDGSKAVGRHAHTSRLIWDKHWHGGNRAKQANLSADDLITAQRCHMCGGQDSQHHAFRWCSHSNIRGVRIETMNTLRDYERG